jgi:beta-lactamase superfamily II metal-dependent hydrolase
MPYPSPYIAIIDVGHGNSTVLRDGNEIVVIDCGAKSSGLLDFLHKEEIKEIKMLFISHADQDHLGGLLGLLSSEEFTIHEVIVNSDSTKQSGIWNDLLYELDYLNEKGKIRFHIGISRSKALIKCGEIEIEIASPTPFLGGRGVGSTDIKERTITSNSLSASFKIYWQKVSVAYLAGDIDLIGLEDMLRHEADIQSQLLLFPHHGGRTGHTDPVPFTEVLCDRVRPDTVIFSIGRNRFENPKPEIVKTVRRTIKNVRISCTQLSKNCMKNISVKLSSHLVDMFSNGREDNNCCSGTFVVKLGEKVLHYPATDPHITFIKSAAKTPMCIS